MWKTLQCETICHLSAGSLEDILHPRLSWDSLTSGTELYGLCSSALQRTHHALHSHWQQHTLSAHLSPVRKEITLVSKNYIRLTIKTFIFFEQSKQTFSANHLHSFSSSCSILWETGAAQHLFTVATAGCSCGQTFNSWPLRPNGSTEQILSCKKTQICRVKITLLVSNTFWTLLILFKFYLEK